MRHKRETSEAVTDVPFQLELPKPFDIKPTHTVALINGHKALIYKTVDERGREKPVAAWRVLLVGKSGNPLRSIQSERTFTNDLDVTLFIQSAARFLARRKKVTTTTEENDYDE